MLDLGVWSCHQYGGFHPSLLETSVPEEGHLPINTVWGEEQKE